MLGAGNVGHAVAALAGSRLGIGVTLWSRRFRHDGRATIRVHGRGGTFGVADVTLAASPRKAVKDADIVLLTVPAHVRHELLSRLAKQLRDCALLVAWEGMGRFAESLHEAGLAEVTAAGLQKSPILCRTRLPLREVEILGVRSSVVMAAVRPEYTTLAKQLLEHILPFRLVVAPSYSCVSLSPSNPLIHPARLYAWSEGNHSVGSRFYADWNDGASIVLLKLHAELKRLRGALGIRPEFVRTLADRRLTPAMLTREITSEQDLAEIMLPLRSTGSGRQLDDRHRFFREDIGEGLRYIVAMASRTGVPMPTGTSICRWYDQRSPRPSRRA